MFPLFAILLACRPDLGAPSYPDLGDDSGGGDDTGLGYNAGPDPYVAGEDRLSLGYFYEGPSSEVDVPENLYIYSSTFTISSSEDCVEGEVSDVWTHAGLAWWGGGLHWDAARDLSGWSTLNIDLMAPAEGGIAAVDMAMTGDTEGRLALTEHGYAADGEWHHVVIDLSDFEDAGADLTLVTIPFVLVGESSAEGETLFIDNLFLE